MAQKEVIQLIDDLDGSEAIRTVRFGLYGKAYEIELNDEHTAELEAALAPYISAGRAATSSKRSTRSTRKPSSRATGSGIDSAAVRRWAQAQGIEVNPRGRIKKEVMDQFLAAGN